MATLSPGEKWKSAREAAGLSVRQAAKVSGIYHNTIYDLEKDDDGVTLRLMKKYADAIGVSLGEIFAGDETMLPERVPAELRPLLEPLALLDQQARKSVVRNIASNLRFMQMLYGEEGSKTRSPVTTSVQGEKVWRNEERAERATWRGQPRRQQKGRKKNQANDRTEVGGDLGLPDTEKE